VCALTTWNATVLCLCDRLMCAQQIGSMLGILSAQSLYDLALRNPLISAMMARALGAVLPAVSVDLLKATGSGSGSGSGSALSTRWLLLWAHVQRCGEFDGDGRVVLELELIGLLTAVLTHAPALVEREPHAKAGAALLTAALRHEEVCVRRAALKAIRLWTESSPTLILSQGFDHAVLSAIDSEQHDVVRTEMELLYEHFVTALVPLPPITAAGTGPAAEPNWRRLMRACFLTVTGTAPDTMNAPTAGGREGGSGAGGGSDKPGREEDVDDSDAIYKEAAARAAGVRTSESRTRTKVFGVLCVDLILHTLRTAALSGVRDNHDFDFAHAKRHDPSRSLYAVWFMSDLIRLACLSSSATGDAQQVAGLRLLHRLLTVFADCSDMNQSLLSMHGEASINSTLRQALTLKPEGKAQAASSAAPERGPAPQLRLIACDVVTPTVHTSAYAGALAERFVICVRACVCACVRVCRRFRFC
jgi:hypothetical protein